MDFLSLVDNESAFVSVDGSITAMDKPAVGLDGVNYEVSEIDSVRLAAGYVRNIVDRGFEFSRK